MSRPNPDIEPDIIAERRNVVRDIYLKHGQHTRMILMIADLLKIDRPVAADAWQKAGIEIEDALHGTGKFYG